VLGLVAKTPIVLRLRYKVEWFAAGMDVGQIRSLAAPVATLQVVITVNVLGVMKSPVPSVDSQMDHLLVFTILTSVPVSALAHVRTVQKQKMDQSA